MKTRSKSEDRRKKTVPPVSKIRQSLQAKAKSGKASVKAAKPKIRNARSASRIPTSPSPSPATLNKPRVAASKKSNPGISNSRSQASSSNVQSAEPTVPNLRKSARVRKSTTKSPTFVVRKRQIGSRNSKQLSPQEVVKTPNSVNRRSKRKLSTSSGNDVTELERTVDVEIKSSRVSRTRKFRNSFTNQKVSDLKVQETVVSSSRGARKSGRPSSQNKHPSQETSIIDTEDEGADSVEVKQPSSSRTSRGRTRASVKKQDEANLPRGTPNRGRKSKIDEPMSKENNIVDTEDVVELPNLGRFRGRSKSQPNKKDDDRVDIQDLNVISPRVSRFRGCPPKIEEPETTNHTKDMTENIETKPSRSSRARRRSQSVVNGEQGNTIDNQSQEQIIGSPHASRLRVRTPKSEQPSKKSKAKFYSTKCNEADRNTHLSLPTLDPDIVKRYDLKPSVVHIHPTPVIPPRKRTRPATQNPDEENKDQLETSGSLRKGRQNKAGASENVESKPTKRLRKQSVVGTDKEKSETPGLSIAPREYITNINCSPGEPSEKRSDTVPDAAALPHAGEGLKNDEPKTPELPKRERKHMAGPSDQEKLEPIKRARKQIFDVNKEVPGTSTSPELQATTTEVNPCIAPEGSTAEVNPCIVPKASTAEVNPCIAPKASTADAESSVGEPLSEKDLTSPGETDKQNMSPLEKDTKTAKAKHKGKKQITYVPPPKNPPPPDLEIETVPGDDSWELRPEIQRVALDYYNSKRESSSSTPTTSSTISSDQMEPNAVEAIKSSFFCDIGKNAPKLTPKPSLDRFPNKSSQIQPRPLGNFPSPPKIDNSNKSFGTSSALGKSEISSKSDSNPLHMGRLTHTITFTTPTKPTSSKSSTTFSTPPTANRPIGSCGSISAPSKIETVRKPISTFKTIRTGNSTSVTCRAFPNFDDDDDDEEEELLDLDPIPSIFLPTSLQFPSPKTPVKTNSHSVPVSEPEKSRRSLAAPSNHKYEKGVIESLDEDDLVVLPSQETKPKFEKKDELEKEESDDDAADEANDSITIEDDKYYPKHGINKDHLKKRRQADRRREEVEAPSVFSDEIHPIRVLPNLTKMQDFNEKYPKNNKLTEEQMRSSVMLSRFVKPKNPGDNPAKTARDNAIQDIKADIARMKSIKDGTFNETNEAESSQATNRTRKVKISQNYEVKRIGLDGKATLESKSMEKHEDE